MKIWKLLILFLQKSNPDNAFTFRPKRNSNPAAQGLHAVDPQKLPVRFAVDRVGFLGAGKTTNSGSFEVTYTA